MSLGRTSVDGLPDGAVLREINLAAQRLERLALYRGRLK